MLLAQAEGFDELLAEPALLIGAVLLIAVSIAWIVIARYINSAIRRAAYEARRRAATRKKRERKATVPPPPDNQIWDYPP